MAYSAVDAVESAYGATKSLLLPFELRRWLVLGVVVFFASGATGFNINANSGAVDVPTPGPGPGPGPGMPQPGLVFDTPVIVAGIAIALLLLVVFTFIGAVMEFVFVRIATTRDVRIRGPFGANTSKGVSLFVFRLLLAFVVLATALFLFALVFGIGVAGLVVALLLSPVVLLGLLALYLVHRFTIDFVVPVMLAEDTGLVEGWRAFVPELRENPGEYATYALVRFALGVAAGIVSGIGTALVAIVVGIPFAVIGLVLFGLEAIVGLGSALFVVGGIVVALFAIAVTVASVVVIQVPVSTYLRYYPLFVLADVSPAYDLLDEVRRTLETAPASEMAEESDVDSEETDTGGAADDDSTDERP